MTIAHDATIRSLMPTLRNPEDYLCGVLRNMQAWARRRGREGFVTLGVTGKGIAPHYRIDFTWGGATPDWVGEAYDGTSHHRLPYTVSVVKDDTWSIAFMAHAEVRTLLGEHRSVLKTRHGRA